MFQEGLIEEVKNLLASGLTGEEKPFESLGYQQALSYLKDNMTVDEAIASTQLGTRQYAKRQWTWFRRDIQIHWLSGFGEDNPIREQAQNMVRRFL